MLFKYYRYWVVIDIFQNLCSVGQVSRTAGTVAIVPSILTKTINSPVKKKHCAFF